MNNLAEIERYKNRLKEDQKDYNYFQLYYRDITLGIGKYTIKEAQEILNDCIDNHFKDNSKLEIKEIHCSVEFFDSLKRKITDLRIRYMSWELKPIFGQKEDIIIIK